MRRCAKCGYNIVAEQEDVRTGMCSILCCSCFHRSKEMPLMVLARMAWNLEIEKAGGHK